MRRVTALGLAFVFWVCALSRAADEPKAAPVDPPRSPAAVSALNKADVAVKRAEEAYVQSVLTAKRQCLKELDAAIKQAMQGSNLEEANRISSSKKAIAAEIEQLTTGGKPRPSAAKTVYLEELQEESVEGAQWNLTKNGKIHGMPIVVGGVESAHGIGLNPSDGATARIKYKLDGRYRRLTGAAAINDSSKAVAGPVIFKVIGDGRELWKARTSGKPGTFPFDVEITKVATLELVSECPGAAAGAHVVWLEPQLTER